MQCVAQLKGKAAMGSDHWSGFGGDFFFLSFFLSFPMVIDRIVAICGWRDCWRGCC
jgi:hypothetical protein